MILLAILVPYITKCDGKFYLQIFLERLWFVKEALHVTRWWDWCFPEDEKKEVEPIFTDKIVKCKKLVKGAKMLLVCSSSI